MNAIVPSNPPAAPMPWQPSEHEGPDEFEAFVLWCFCGYPSDPELASRFRWTERRNALEQIASIPRDPKDRLTQAVFFSLDRAHLSARQAALEAAENPERGARMADNDIREWVKLAAGIDMPDRAATIDWSKAPPEVLEAHQLVSQWVSEQ